MKSNELLLDLSNRTQKVIQSAEKFKQLSNVDLNFKQTEDTWSVLECLEHLNFYANFYLPEIKNKIDNSTKDSSSTFKSSFLGNYFAKSMLPKEKLNKMKTFKNMNPNNSKLDSTVLDKFITHQNIMLELLETAQKSNLSKIRTSISISKWIKIRLGDTFRVVIFHNERHIQQANKIFESK